MKLTMMRGLPGSGKTTRARKMVEDHGNVGRINRDDLRAMLFNGKWSGRREAVVVEVEKAIAATLLDCGQNVVVDDTNLQRRHHDIWREVAGRSGTELAVVDVDTPRQKCIANDFIHRQGTPAYVGALVINRMAAQSGRFEWPDKPIAIFDIDGTLADGHHREHLIYAKDGEKKDWTTYFERCDQDAPVEFVIHMLYALYETHTIVIVSGRPDTYYLPTFWWFEKHNIPFDALFMRAGNDKRSDVDVKNDILKLLPKDKIDVVFDDRPAVCRMWRANGIRVIPVRGACEEF